MIHRDGNRESLWQAHATPYESTVANNNDQFDVIVIGGGITGISTGLLLQEAGKKVLVMDAQNLCFGTTGGTTAHLNTLLDTPYTTISSNFGADNAKLTADAVKEALALVKTNIKTHLIDCEYMDADAYLFAQNEQQEKELESILSATTDAGVDTHFAASIPVNIPFTKAIRVTGQGKFSPVAYVHGLAKAFEKAGGTILQYCTARDLQEEGEGLTVVTTKGNFHTRDVVYATHIPPGVNLLHLRCAPYRSYAMAILLNDEEIYPEDLSYDMEDPYHYYRTQIIDGQPYLIAGGKDHKTGHEENTDHCFRTLEAEVRKHFRIKEIVHQWSSQYFEPTDGLPYIGHLPGTPEHVFVATGFGGNGMVYSSVAALLLRQLILNETSPYEKLFNPNRIKPVAGFTNFIKHNADVVKLIAEKLFHKEKIPQLASLAPGEGCLVEYEGDKLAIYKSEQHDIHALRPTCTHMGCDVKWNSAERSWDCPCHGARYDIEGNVLTGPADEALEKVRISE